jgi:hypothetical protein
VSVAVDEVHAKENSRGARNPEGPRVFRKSGR